MINEYRYTFFTLLRCGWQKMSFIDRKKFEFASLDKKNKMRLDTKAMLQILGKYSRTGKHNSYADSMSRYHVDGILKTTGY